MKRREPYMIIWPDNEVTYHADSLEVAEVLQEHRVEAGDEQVDGAHLYMLARVVEPNGYTDMPYTPFIATVPCPLCDGKEWVVDGEGRVCQRCGGEGVMPDTRLGPALRWRQLADYWAQAYVALAKQ